MEKIINVPLTDGVERVRYGSIGWMEFRDTVNGVRVTAHGRDGQWWIVRHEGHTSASDGTPVARSEIFTDRAEWCAAWAAVRSAH